MRFKGDILITNRVFVLTPANAPFVAAKFSVLGQSQSKEAVAVREALRSDDRYMEVGRQWQREGIPDAARMAEFGHQIACGAESDSDRRVAFLAAAVTATHVVEASGGQPPIASAAAGVADRVFQGVPATGEDSREPGHDSSPDMFG